MGILFRLAATTVEEIKSYVPVFTITAGGTSVSSSDTVTASNILTFSGTGTNGDIVRLYENGEILTDNLVINNGTWTYTTTALPNASYTFNADYSFTGQLFVVTNQTDDFIVNVSYSETSGNPTTPTTAPIISVKANGVAYGTNTVTDDHTLTFDGTGENGLEAKLYQDGVLITTQTIASGVWSYTTTALADGDYYYTQTIFNPFTNETSPTSSQFHAIIDAIPATPTFTVTANGATIASGSSTTDDTLTFSGTGTNGYQAKLYQDGALVTTQNISGGTWSYTTNPLALATYAYTLVIYNPNSSTSSPTSSAFNVTIGMAVVYKGYWAGGNTGSILSEIDGIRFDTEAAVNPGATLSVARYGGMGVNSTTKGYVLGGFKAGSLRVTDIDGMQFSDETAINPSATIPTAIYLSGNVSSPSAGYIAGGNTAAGQVKTMAKFGFSTESASGISATLSAIVQGLAGIQDNNYGYFCGGYNIVARIEQLSFSTETNSLLAIVLPVGRGYVSGVSGSTKGYCCGGHVTSTPKSDIDGINFSTVTIINPSASLATARGYAAGVNSTTKGYIGGGSTNGASTGMINEIDGINLDTEVAVNPSATLSTSRFWLSSFSYR